MCNSKVTVNNVFFYILSACLDHSVKCAKARLFLFYGLGQTLFILWFTDIFAPYPMSGFGMKINFSDIRHTLVIKQERAYPSPHKGINYSE